MVFQGAMRSTVVHTLGRPPVSTPITSVPYVGVDDPDFAVTASVLWAKVGPDARMRLRLAALASAMLPSRGWRGPEVDGCLLSPVAGLVIFLRPLGYYVLGKALKITIG